VKISREATQLAYLPVDTTQDLIRHGETPSTAKVAVANATQTPALLRFTLFDPDGNEKGRYEQILPIGTQREWSLADLFNVQEFKGSIRFWSDTPVNLSNKRITDTLRGETIESEISYVDGNAKEVAGGSDLPAIWDGAGLATKITFVNPTTADADIRINFDSSDGQPAALALR
jgi:hypothetical protein